MPKTSLILDEKTALKRKKATKITALCLLAVVFVLVVLIVVAACVTTSLKPNFIKNPDRIIVYNQNSTYGQFSQSTQLNDSRYENFISQFMGSLGILTPNGISMGLVQIVRSDQLEASLSNGGIASHLGAYKNEVAEMKPINTAEKFMATLVLAADGTVGQTLDSDENGSAFSYSVSGYEVEDPNGTDYWVFAIEITMS